MVRLVEGAGAVVIFIGALIASRDGALGAARTCEGAEMPIHEPGQATSTAVAPAAVLLGVLTLVFCGALLHLSGQGHRGAEQGSACWWAPRRSDHGSADLPEP